MRKLLLALSVAGFLAILSSTASKSPTLPLFAKELGAGPGGDRDHSSRLDDYGYSG